MKTNKIIPFLWLLSAAALLLPLTTACESKPKTTDIIARKPVKATPLPVQKMGDYVQKRTVEWLGANYEVRVERKADSEMPLALDEQGNKYYDNRITLSIQRPDGTEFFRHTFTKESFASYVDEANMKGALLGIVFDRAEGASLWFAASVGSPDKMSDEYVPLLLKISRGGGISIARDTQLDTTNADDTGSGGNSVDDEDDGV